LLICVWITAYGHFNVVEAQIGKLRVRAGTGSVRENMAFIQKTMSISGCGPRSARQSAEKQPEMILDKSFFCKIVGRRTAGIGVLVSMAVSLGCPAATFAGAITLGTAQSFAVLGAAGVTVGGANGTVVSGNVGDYPIALSSITGFPTPGSLANGSFYALDQLPLIAQQAQADENTAYNTLVGLSSTANETGITLGTGGTASTLLPGIYAFSGSAEVDGALTLNFNGLSNSLFVFQIGSTLTTGSSASINVIGANSTDAIYWQVGTSATLGSSTAFAGNILASDAITLNPFASIACESICVYGFGDHGRQEFHFQ
jgi:hypothetical protein